MDMASIPNWILVLIVSLVGYLLNRLLKGIDKRTSDTEIELQKHKEECDKIPKSLILEKVDNLCIRLDEHRIDTREFMKDVKDEFNTQRHKQDEVNATLIKIAAKV